MHMTRAKTKSGWLGLAAAMYAAATIVSADARQQAPGPLRTFTPEEIAKMAETMPAGEGR
jgi:hypothetical protein